MIIQSSYYPFFAVYLNLQACSTVSPPFSQLPSSTRHHDLPVTHKRINPMITRAETSQLHFLAIFNLLGVAISPFHWHFRVRVCVDQDIERAVACFQLWKEGHGGGDLAEDGLDFELDFLLCLFGGWLRSISAYKVRKGDGRMSRARRCLHWRSILFVRRLCRVLGGYFLRRPVEDLDIELPSLDMFTSLLAGDYDYQFRYLAACHPFVELGHDLLDVCFDLIIGSDKHVEAIFLDARVKRSEDINLNTIQLHTL